MCITNKLWKFNLEKQKQNKSETKTHKYLKTNGRIQKQEKDLN